MIPATKEVFTIAPPPCGSGSSTSTCAVLCMKYECMKYEIPLMLKLKLVREVGPPGGILMLVGSVRAPVFTSQSLACLQDGEFVGARENCTNDAD